MTSALFETHLLGCLDEIVQFVNNIITVQNFVGVQRRITAARAENTVCQVSKGVGRRLAIGLEIIIDD